MTAATAQEYVIRDGRRNVKFVGEKLAQVSSERSSSPRWTVMELYRTTNESLYVVSRVGMSTVYHTSDCTLAVQNRLPYGHELRAGVPNDEEMELLRACVQCRPRRGDPAELLRFEQERHWAGIAETPEACIDMLYRNDNGARSLPWIAANLLSEASRYDAPLAHAYAEQTL